jgi:hypothetical protein
MIAFFVNSESENFSEKAQFLQPFPLFCDGTRQRRQHAPKATVRAKGDSMRRLLRAGALRKG